jgi:hypothetical protein
MLLCSRNAHGRVNGTLTRSADNGDSWKVLSTIDSGSFAYSCLSLLPSVGGGERGYGVNGGDGGGSGVTDREAAVNSTHVGVIPRQYCLLTPDP